jgi:UDP-N-acetylglucosamine acyltransferase
VHPHAKIGNNVTVGPFSVIGEHVEIGESTWIGPHVVIEGHTKIGANNKIFQFVAIGAPPQDKKYAGEDTGIIIGDDNFIREYCSIHCGTPQGRKVTKIGNKNFLMNYVHIAHDCALGNEVVLTNNTALAGHVTLGNYVVLGGFAKVVQFCSIGDYSFIGGETGVVKDVPPYVLVSGYHGGAKLYGLNLVGLRRRGFRAETLKHLKHAYNIIYRKDLVLQDAIAELEKMIVLCQEVKLFVDFLKNTKHGIIR